MSHPAAAPKVTRLHPLAPSNPSMVDKPAFLMNFPFSYSAREPNNPWMQDLEPDKRVIDSRKAMRQWLDLYHFMAAEAVIYLLPTPNGCRLQDLTFTANLGAVLEHLPDRNVAVLSNFTSAPRIGETDVGEPFFAAMGYRTVVAPHKFEGDAELKHLHDNVYVGGYGIRSERATYRWMEDTFDMKVIAVQEADDYLYHLDCSIFPLTREDTLVCTELFAPEELAALEQETNVIDVASGPAFAGICNSVRLNNSILNASHIHELKAGSEEYRDELAKNRRLEDIASERGFEVGFFNLSEYHKGGALLSCLVMHLNRNSYGFRLL